MNRFEQSKLSPFVLLGAGLCLVLLVAVGGCNKHGTVKVRATVMLDGKPLEGASIRFHRLDDSTTRGASGITDDNGQVRMSTFSPGDGVLPGEYVVTVSKQDEAGDLDSSLKPPPPPEDETEEEAKARKVREAAFAATTGSLVPKYSKGLPRKYRIRGESPLRCTVPPESAVVFELSSNE